MSTISTTLRKLWNKHSYIDFKRYIDYFHPNDPVFTHIQSLPPIVNHNKIISLRKDLIQCEDKNKFLLHAGDCAQPFQHVKHQILENKMKFFKACKTVLEGNVKKKSVLIGRIAGQYAKPRSSQFTYLNGKKIHNYKGDNVNSYQADQRNPQQSKLCEGYFNSIVTHNYINQNMSELYVSHEGLILPYQAALTRKIQFRDYCLSAHMLWIGQRTRQLDGAHIQFFRGIQNPVGIKISSKVSNQQFCDIIKTLNPLNQKGKLLIIIRMGKQNIKNRLHQLIECKKRFNLNFLFVSDPMHGNTFQSEKADNLKVRGYDDILSQLKHFKSEMKKNELSSGLSLQATFEDVLQCFGGTFPLREEDIRRQKYTSKCDPRLNWNQTLKLLSETNLA